jgi:hypothetical protein
MSYKLLQKIILYTAFSGILFFQHGNCLEISEPCLTEETCEASIRPFHLNLRQTLGRGIGFNTGYTTFEDFWVWQDAWNDIQPFIDLRAHYFHNAKWAVNAGIGGRYLSEKNQRIFGANIYYDYRHTKHHSNSFNQIGIGFESLGTSWDLRANGYIPLNYSKHQFVGEGKFEKFEQHQFIISDRIEFAMAGADAEIGALLGCLRKWDIYAAAGPYYFKGKKNDRAAAGGKIRLTALTSDIVKIDLMASYDEVFKGRVNGQLSIALPIGARSTGFRSSSQKCNQSCALKHVRMRIMEPVERQEIIVLDRKHQSHGAINPLTDRPYHVLFVDNTANSDGQGTFEAPYNTLSAAESASEPNEIIYVFAGNGTSTGLNKGFVMQDGQQLLGSGMVHMLPNGDKDPFVVPALTKNSPIITNNLSRVITLANNNTVSGFHIDAPEGFASIFAEEAKDINISDNFFSYLDKGIDIGQVKGELFIINNTFQGQGKGVGVDLVSNDEKNSEILIENNSFTSTGISISISSIDSGNVFSTISNNKISDTSLGISVSSFDNSHHEASILGNHIENSTLYGISSSSLVDSSLESTIVENIITNAGIGIISVGTTPSSHKAVVSHNIISDSTQNGILMQSFSSKDYFVIESNTITNSRFEGIKALNGNDEFHTLNISENSLIGNGGRAGVYVQNGGTSQLCLCLINNNSDIGYLLNNLSSNAFNLDASGNIGDINEAGSITNVPAGTCN